MGKELSGDHVPKVLMNKRERDSKIALFDFIFANKLIHPGKPQIVNSMY